MDHHVQEAVMADLDVPYQLWNKLLGEDRGE